MRTKLEELMIITMEECGELIQACSKKLRGKKECKSIVA
jgi:NTP pyrophosphatase (non-canonical NTP hydrolase)